MISSTTTINPRHVPDRSSAGSTLTALCLGVALAVASASYATEGDVIKRVGEQAFSVASEASDTLGVAVSSCVEVSQFATDGLDSIRGAFQGGGSDVFDHAFEWKAANPFSGAVRPILATLAEPGA